MLEIELPEREMFDEELSEFINIKKTTLQLEHSLLSLSKWEAKRHKPFLSKDQKTDDEILDYIKCMTINQGVNPMIYLNLPGHVYKEIEEYINAPMTATWFSENPNDKKSREVIPAEIIYYWMIAQNIPTECQEWHLNRLLTLIRVCSIKNTPKGKQQTKKSSLSDRAALNAARKSKWNTKG